MPVWGKQLYAFAEHGTDLGSSKHVTGNPSAIYRREGRGSSYGAGVKVGIVRFEYTANSTGRADWYALFGERF